MQRIDAKDLPQAIETEFEALHRSLAYEIAARIIDNAPADTGNLKGSIRVSKERNKGDWEDDVSGEATKRKNERDVKDATIKDDLYGEVGADYGRFVDEGSSTNPPTGFFSSVVSNIKAALDEAKKDSQRNRFK